MALHSSDSDHLGQALGVQQAFPMSRLCPFPLLALALSRGSGLDFASWPGTCLCVCVSATLGCFPASDGKVLTASHPTVIGSVPQAWRLSCHVQLPRYSHHRKQFYLLKEGGGWAGMRGRREYVLGR